MQAASDLDFVIDTDAATGAETVTVTENKQARRQGAPLADSLRLSTGDAANRGVYGMRSPKSLSPSGLLLRVYAILLGAVYALASDPSPQEQSLTQTHTHTHPHRTSFPTGLPLVISVLPLRPCCKSYIVVPRFHLFLG